MLCWETDPGYAVHLLNYTNQDAQHGWLQGSFRLGPQTVTMKLPERVRVKSVELLKVGSAVQFSFDNQVLHFTVPHVDDYEVAAISIA